MPFTDAGKRPGPFTTTSVTSGSLSRNSMGPIPTTASDTAFTTAASELCGSMCPCSRRSDSASSRTRTRRSARGITSSCRASTRALSRRSARLQTSTSRPGGSRRLLQPASEPFVHPSEATALAGGRPTNSLPFPSRRLRCGLVQSVGYDSPPRTASSTGSLAGEQRVAAKVRERSVSSRHLKAARYDPLMGQSAGR